MNSFYGTEELNKIGFKRVGKDVLISRKASIYTANSIQIGDNVRIDDFCILSGNILIGNHVHVAAYSALYAGKAGITLRDFANISSRVCIFAISDDYSGATMTNPTIPDRYKDVKSEPVCIGRHVIVGTGSTLLPGITLADGTAIGAMSMCNSSTEPWKLYAGIPAKFIKDRKKDLLILEKEFSNEQNLCDKIIDA